MMNDTSSPFETVFICVRKYCLGKIEDLAEQFKLQDHNLQYHLK